VNFSSRRRRRRVAEINLIPLIDLFLNILVFFIVTTTFASSDSLFFVELPETAAGDSGEVQKLVSINIGPEGQISMDNREVTIDQLRERLVQIPPDRKRDFPVVLRADKNSRHGSVVSVLDLVHKLGLQNIGIATKTTQSE